MKATHPQRNSVQQSCYKTIICWSRCFQQAQVIEASYVTSSLIRHPAGLESWGSWGMSVYPKFTPEAIRLTQAQWLDPSLLQQEIHQIHILDCYHWRCHWRLRGARTTDRKSVSSLCHLPKAPNFWIMRGFKRLTSTGWIKPTELFPLEIRSSLTRVNTAPHTGDDNEVPPTSHHEPFEYTTCLSPTAPTSGYARPPILKTPLVTLLKSPSVTVAVYPSKPRLDPTSLKYVDTAALW